MMSFIRNLAYFCTVLNILSIHQLYNEPFKPKSTTKQLPLGIHKKEKETVSLEEVIVHARLLKSTYKVTQQEALNLEHLTKLQSKCCLCMGKLQSW